jgi:Right handed beta helix region
VRILVAVSLAMLAAGCTSAVAGGPPAVPSSQPALGGSAPGVPAPGVPAPGVPAPAGPAPHRVVPVSGADALRAALAGALPGDRIELADGSYEGKFTITRDGTQAAPIVLAGSARAAIDGGGIKGGRALTLQADWWRLTGFTIHNGQKGLMAEGANHTVVDGLTVYDIGDEAIHFQKGSSDNLIQNCAVHDTGKRRPGFGEAIYLGSANGNWENKQPDHSDRNKVVGNHLGPDIAAEPVDIKEGTSGGEIRGNTFDGHGQSGENSAESWVNAKGNGYLIADNTGAAAYASGFKARTVYPGNGCGNTFRHNTGTVAPYTKAGYAFDITNNTDCPGNPNKVCTDNTVTGAASGTSQIPETRC